MKRFVVRLAVTGLVAAVLTALPIAASPASAATSPLGYTLEGCQQDGPHAGHLTLPNSDGQFICPDNAYTTGNLAKGWNELDLVPHRVSLTANTAESDTITLAGDQQRTAGSAVIGWDYVSAPVLNTRLSTATGCVAPTDPGTYQNDGPKVGGTFTTATRTVTFAMPATSGNNKCVYDYYQRLAVGAAGFSGSSLQSYIIGPSGQKRISLPVNEISPQTLAKDMTATQDSDYAWNVTKSATPATLTFTNTCATASGSSGTTVITISWQRFDASPSGDITVITNVTATNPAARSVTVNATDILYSGTTQLQTHLFPDTVIPAGSTEPVGTAWVTTVPSGTTDLNDVATGHYTDTVTGQPVTGTTTATATATVQAGTASNSTATITDSESITGTGLTFSVATPSVGSFTGGYVAGTQTTGPVTWSSGTQSGSGSVDFNKTVYAAHGTSTTSGVLSDTATLTTSGGVTHTASATVNITSATLGTITVVKTIPNVLQGSDTASFTFHLQSGTTYSAAAADVASFTFTFTASTPLNGLGRPTLSHDFTGLAAGDYVLHEDQVTGWALQTDRVIHLTGDNVCGATTTVNNQNTPATASAQKVTVPGGFAAGFGAGPCVATLPSDPNPTVCPWAFRLSQGTTTLATVAADATGAVNFGDLPGEGSYTITEVLTTAQAASWDQTGATGCSFTVNFPADNGHNFACTITNTERGHIVVYKHTNPAGSTQQFTFTPSYNGGATFQLTDGGNNDSGALTPGGYSVSETEPTGWTADPAHPTTCTDGTSSYSAGSITLVAGRTVRCDFYNVEYGHLSVHKTVSGGAIPSGQSYVFTLRHGASTTNAGTQLSSVTVDSTHNPVAFPVNLLPGTYQVCEMGVQAGWSTSLSTGGFVLFSSTGDNSNICHNETVGAGDDITVNVDNTPPPGGGARTIGYWKNWASCRTSGGKQAPVLDRTLYSMEPGGLYLGGVTLHDTSTNPDLASDCVAVVRLLNKSTIGSGAKMASDPAFNLAAQLVAALLNKAAGATFPSCAATAAADAQSLLAAIHFNGNTHDTMTDAQKQRALNDAGALDRYNNSSTHC